MRPLTFLFLLLPLYMFGRTKIISPSSILGSWGFYEGFAIIGGDLRTYSPFQQSGNQIEGNLANKGRYRAFYIQQKSSGTILIGPSTNNLLLFYKRSVLNFACSFIDAFGLRYCGLSNFAFTVLQTATFGIQMIFFRDFTGTDKCFSGTLIFCIPHR